MTPIKSLKARAGLLVAGLASFLALLAVIRWSSGEAIVQPSSDVGVVLGFALVALYFVVSDARASKAGPTAGRARELN